MNHVLGLLSWLAAQWGAAMLNSLVPGLVLAALGWGVLKALPRLNSSTRFALGFSLLAAVTVLPVLIAMPASRGAVASVAATVTPMHGARTPLAWPGWLETTAALIWLCISLLLVIRLLVACRDLASLRRSCRPADPDWLATLDLPRRAQASICLSNKVSSPLAMGIWHPVVVLPTEMPRECDREDLRRVLLHELEHIRRGDNWTHVLQQILMAVLFFQPATWWLNGFLAEEREAACDDAVLAVTGEARGYAACLARLAEHGLQRRVPAWAAGAVSRPSLLRRRVLRILQGGRDVSNHLSRPVLAASLATVAIVLTAAARLPRFVAPEPVAWPIAAGLPSLHPQWEMRQTQAATDFAKDRIDAQAAETLRATARLRATAARRAAVAPRHAEMLAEALPSHSRMDDRRQPVASPAPQASAWRVVEMQSVQWDAQGQVMATRMVFIVTGPQAVRLLQNPPPVFF